MNWKLIDKSKTVQPSTGGYRSWKPILANEGFHQCVYCSIHEHPMGGTRNFAVEHYKPKSLFETLRDTITNLFYACSICNGFKSNDWHNNTTTDFTQIVYPDPSVTDYSLLFSVDESNGYVRGKNIAGNYIVERLYLNRPQLILDRKLQIAQNEFEKVNNLFGVQFAKLCELTNGNNDALDFIKAVYEIKEKARLSLKKITETRPYTAEQISKSK